MKSNGVWCRIPARPRGWNEAQLWLWAVRMNDQRLTLVASDLGTKFCVIERGRFRAGDALDRIVGVVSPNVAHLINTAAARHTRSSQLPDALTLLVEEAATPVDDRTAGLEVTSFLASGAIAETLTCFEAPLDEWCYLLMAHVLRQLRITCELHVVHRPASYEAGFSDATSATSTCDVILPHRGVGAHLRLSVDSLRRQTRLADVRIAIDQEEVDAGFLADIASEPRVHAYQLSPCRVGPYVARHVLSTRSRADMLAFQDADDLSLPHRLAALAAAAETSDAGIIGSHELQVHENHRKVYAIRYPLDVNASLNRAGANHQLLLPTSLVKRDVITRVGGFSTYRAFSLDVPFWLSASFTTTIVNVDDFLYVRRRHPASLTMRADIGTESVLRRAIVRRRRSDFLAIQEGLLRLNESSLAVRHRRNPVTFTNLKTGEASIWSG